MLKVVGASWEKTRIGTYILLGALLLAFGAFFLSHMERPTYSGTYCATAYWARNSGYRLEYWGQRNDLDQVPIGAVRACFRDSVLENGWSQLELESQSTYTDTVQAHAAGMMEGALTWHNIYMHWSNTIDAVCSKDEESEEFCGWLRGFFMTNVDTVKKMADRRRKHDHYWHQVALFYDQLDGLQTGFRRGVKRSRLEIDIPTSDFLLMNAAVDIRDLKLFYTKVVSKNSGLEPDPAKGMMLLKLLKPQADGGVARVLLGHASDGSYSSMLRMVKKYTLRYHFSSDVKQGAGERNVVPGTNIVFSGYPGVLASLDDFYEIMGPRGHHMLAAGVKLENDNMALWSRIDLFRSISLAPRVMAANRLGYSARAWARYFSRNPSTGVKQWLLIDMKRFTERNVTEGEQVVTSGEYDRAVESNEIPSTSDDQYDEDDVDQPQPGIVTKRMDDYVDDDFEEQHQPTGGRQIRAVPQVTQGANPPSESVSPVSSAFGSEMFWVVDQLPGRMHAEDVTEKIIAAGYWITKGLPYFKEQQELGHVRVTNTTAPGLKEKILHNITDLEMLAKFIRQSGYRGDLDREQPAAYGNIDMKLYSITSEGSAQFRAYSGPLFDRAGSWVTGSTTGQAAKRSALLQRAPAEGGDDANRVAAISTASQPFDWSSVQPLEVRHQGHPDVWDFDHLTPEWAWI
uniref:Phospholipase B-like n=1 Tax=Anopheles triannulatus TaxID=58253 RepID=A0A2M3ZZ00_9DIPT